MDFNVTSSTALETISFSVSYHCLSAIVWMTGPLYYGACITVEARIS